MEIKKRAGLFGIPLPYRNPLRKITTYGRNKKRDYLRALGIDNEMTPEEIQLEKEGSEYLEKKYLLEEKERESRIKGRTCPKFDPRWSNRERIYQEHGIIL